MPANWTSGSFLFPTSTGSFSVSGLPFQPQGLFFIGTNQAAEDVLITTGGAGIFFGMVWLDKDTGAPDAQSVCLIMQHGINVKPHPIIMAASLGCDVDYAASFTSFNADGFTLNVTNAASANRPISWMAYGNMTGANGSANITGSTAFDIGYKALSAFAMNYRTSSRIRDGCENGQYTTLYIGGASYPTVDTPSYNTRSWMSGGCSRFPVTGIQGFTQVFGNINPAPNRASSINISTGDFPPIVLEDRIQFWRDTVPPSPSETYMDMSVGGGPLRWFAKWMTVEAWANSFTVNPTAAATNDFTSGNQFLTEIEAALYVGVLGSSAVGLSADSRMAIGFITKDGQGCVAANRSGHGFQSTQYGAVSRCDSAGVTYAEGTIDHDVIHWETIASTGFSSLGAIIAWGPEGGWLPQIYRRWPY